MATERPKVVLAGTVDLTTLAAASDLSERPPIVMHSDRQSYHIELKSIGRTRWTVTVCTNEASVREGDIVMLSLTVGEENNRDMAIPIGKTEDGGFAGSLDLDIYNPKVKLEAREAVPADELAGFEEGLAAIERSISDKSTSMSNWVAAARRCAEGSQLRKMFLNKLMPRIRHD